MKLFINIHQRFFIIIILVSSILSITACDDNFNDAIEQEKIFVESQKNKPKPFYPGNNGTITIKSLKTYSIRIKWLKSRGKNINPLDITYYIYYSTESNINTIEDAETNGTLIYQDYNINQFTISGLESDTTYFINIIAEDDVGNRIIYTTASAVTRHFEHDD